MHQYLMSRKLSLLVVLAQLTFGLITWYFIDNHTKQSVNALIKTQSEDAMSRIIDAVPAAIVNNDSISIQVVLNKTTQHPFVHSAAYFDSDNMLKAQSTFEKIPISNPIILSRPVRVQENILGRVEVTMDKNKIQSTSGYVLTDWILLWLIYSGLSTYLFFNFVSKMESRAFDLADKLPGENPNESNAFVYLEEKLQPLLGLSQNGNENFHYSHYCSLITGSLVNLSQLKDRLNQESLEKLLDRLDNCVSTTAKLYGGQRIEGDKSTIHLCMRSTDCSKQHLLLCLMLTYSLRQLIRQLASRWSIKIEMKWALLGNQISSKPLFSFHEDLNQLKLSSLEQIAKLRNETIAIKTCKFSVDELSTIARFSHLSENCYLLQAFSIERQELLSKQIQHLDHACFGDEINYPGSWIPLDKGK